MINKTLLFFCAIIITACNLSPFEDAGEYIEVKHVISGITDIENISNFDIILVQDDEEFLILKGGEKKLSKVKITKSDQSITIGHNYNNNVRNFDLIVAEFHVKDLKTITLNAATKVTSANQIKGKHLDINVTFGAELIELDINVDLESLKLHSKGIPSGGFYFSGKCKTTNYIMNGIININASDLKSESINIAQNSIGNAYVNCNNNLTITFYNQGNVFYKGNPIVQTKRIQVNNQKNTGQVFSD